MASNYKLRPAMRSVWQLLYSQPDGHFGDNISAINSRENIYAVYYYCELIDDMSANKLCYSSRLVTTHIANINNMQRAYLLRLITGFYFNGEYIYTTPRSPWWRKPLWR